MVVRLFSLQAWIWMYHRSPGEGAGIFFAAQVFKLKSDHLWLHQSTEVLLLLPKRLKAFLMKCEGVRASYAVRRAESGQGASSSVINQVIHLHVVVTETYGWGNVHAQVILMCPEAQHKGLERWEGSLNTERCFFPYPYFSIPRACLCITLKVTSPL